MRKTQNLLIAVGCRSNLELVQLLLIRDLFLFFLNELFRAAFCRVLASFCDAKFRLCV